MDSPNLKRLLSSAPSSVLTRLAAKALTSQPPASLPPTALGSRLAWQPQAGPQTEAYNCIADVIGYGGAAGGGKSDLGLGLAGGKHKRSLILRREYPRVRALIERSKEIYTDLASYNDQLHIQRFHDGRIIEFGSCQYEDDKKGYQGRPYDLYVFDEVPEFTESMVRFISAWNRTTAPGQHCQILLTFNPPIDMQGDWVNRYFAPWLDPGHKRPAKDGELRWYAMLNGKETELDSSEPFEHILPNGDAELIVPKSRTFFHASLKDNPILEATGYGATIDALPEPLRSILKGNFDAARIDAPFQVIPIKWVMEAQARWKPEAPRMDNGQLYPLTRVGADIALGGDDKTVFSPRRGRWFDKLIKYDGRDTPDGQTIAALFTKHFGGEKPRQTNVDVIGVGATAYDHLKVKFRCVPVNFSEGADYGDNIAVTDSSGTLFMANVRAWAWWSAREALDPSSGLNLALPPDPELLADLCAPQWKMRGNKLYIESKAEIKKRLGRSPDCGDAWVLANFEGGGTIPETQPTQVSKWAEPQTQGSEDESGSKFKRY